MALKSQSIVVQFLAWDTVNNVGKTGDSANFTMRVIKDGSASAPTNSVSEVDSTNCPGVYTITLTASEMSADTITLAGKSSTSGVTIVPVNIVTESGRLDTSVSSRSTLTASDVWSAGTRTITDKTEFSLTSAYDPAKSAASQTSVDTANTNISAIKTKTDSLAFTGNDVKATLDGESVTISTGTGAGQLDISSGIVKSDAIKILGTTLTETTGGYIAAAFKKLFDVATPVFTAQSVNQSGDAYSRLGDPVGASVSADVAAVKTDTAAIKTKTDKLKDTWNDISEAQAKTQASSAISEYAPAKAGDKMDIVNAPNSTGLAAIADAILTRSFSSVTYTGTTRCVLTALQKLRNRVANSSSTQTVYKEDDTTVSYTAGITGSPGADPIVEVDPN